MKRHAVIIDDSLTVRMNLGEAFAEAGFEVTLCASAAEGRDALAADPGALVVLDVVLPDTDGLELLAELREAPATRSTPVILLSTEAEVKDRIRGLTQGADEYVGKPYDASYVVARAAELLRASAPSSSGALTVLVIDDSLTFREELSAALGQAGYRTAVASSGAEGLKRAADLYPDAIVVDGVMPGMDGTAVVRRLRLDPGLGATPCLLLTASEGAAGEVDALDSGADAYVRKSEGLEVVLARLGAMLRGAEESRERAPAASLMGPKRILAVDDSPTYLEHIAEQLRDEGYEVIKARSGEEALELLTVENVDCILLDLRMPGLSGTETCARIKSTPSLRRTPLIMLTALDERESMIEGINAGADDYVTKAASFDVIKARLRAQLRRKQFEDENRQIREELLRKEADAEVARKVAEAHADLLDELSAKNQDLAFHVDELERLNKELETFAYSVSHDLRQPLRGMDGFSKALIERYGDQLDERGLHFLSRIRAGAQRMGTLIDGILVLSRVSRKPVERRPVRLDELARAIINRLREGEPERNVEAHVEPGLAASADPALIESVLENLLGNAWKFTAVRVDARIDVGAQGNTFFIRDNGAGFDMRYADKLFGLFQRLHAASEFDGTGIGLATVQRIVHRHGGRIWADSKPGEGATFFFELRDEANDE